MGKLKVCVLFGGQSPEHEVSRRSAVSVLEQLDRDKYKVSVIGITKKGQWYLYTGDTDSIKDDSWEKDKKHLKKAILSPDVSDGGILVFGKEKVKKIEIDVAFPVLHGEHGEDGTIQGLLELANLPYVGTGVLASSVGMDKTYSKIVFQDANIPQAKWVVARTEEFHKIDEIMDEIEEKIGYPCFVKPANTGSSVGVGKAKDRDALLAALEEASRFDRKILVEENIEGHEVECAVLGNGHPKAAAVGEIIPVAEFYDYDAKYNDGTTELQIPAKLDRATQEKIRDYAVRAFRAIDGTGLSRVDFFVKYSDGSVILNEINTMPGFTDISMYPKLWQEMGVGYSELLDRLIELALHRKKHRYEA